MKTKTLLTLLIAAAVGGGTAQNSRAQDIDSVAPVVVKTVPEAGARMFRLANTKSKSPSARK